MSRDFPAPISDQEQVVVKTAASAQADVTTVASMLKAVTGVVAVGQPQLLEQTHWLIPVTLSGQPISATSRATVDHLEHLPFPHQVQLTGPTADALALNSSLRRHLPLAGAILIAATVIGLSIHDTGKITSKVGHMTCGLFAIEDAQQDGISPAC